MTSTVLNWNSRKPRPFQSEEFEFQEFEWGSRRAERKRGNPARARTSCRQQRAGARAIPRRLHQESRERRRPGGEIADRTGDRRRPEGCREEGLAHGRPGAWAATSAARSAPRSALASPMPPARRSASSLSSARARSWNSPAPASSCVSPPIQPNRRPAPLLPAPIRAPLHKQAVVAAARKHAAGTAWRGSWSGRL